MENKVQLLTQKIYEEGVVKANEEAAKILAEAHEKAAALVKEAQGKAYQISEQAKRASEELRENVHSEIQLAARQAISALRQEVANAITFKSSSTPLAQAVSDQDFMKEIIEIAVRNWSQNGHSQTDLSLILPENAQSQVDNYLTSSVRSLLDKGLELQFSKRLGNGFRIGPADGSYVVSFSENDFDNLFKDYLRPKTVELLFGDK
ncbi:MAG: V-type ATP synthase subunit E [Saprospiraceae bacterium]|jgi:V/A-type H+-transporting ATPase subunit E|nr:V-type ATP synthase subunit E [Saprospiraceae bacterium]